MIRATWNGTVLAETPRTVRVEGNHYFPPGSVHREHLIESPIQSVCPWKGLARYYTVAVYGEVNPDAAWYYPHPSPVGAADQGSCRVLERCAGRGRTRR